MAGARTTCRHGHPWTEANTYVKPRTGVRECRTCHRERMRRDHARGYLPARQRIEVLNDPAWVRERYVERGLTIRAIAAELGCTPRTVRQAMLRHAIEVRPRWDGA